jgi:hypothetical protein
MDKRDYPSFSGHTGDMPSRFTSDDDDRPTAADGSGCAAALTSPSEAGDDHAVPQWFADFLIDRATREPSAHRIKAYRQDFAGWPICWPPAGRRRLPYLT